MAIHAFIFSVCLVFKHVCFQFGEELLILLPHTLSRRQPSVVFATESRQTTPSGAWQTTPSGGFLWDPLPGRKPGRGQLHRPISVRQDFLLLAKAWHLSPNSMMHLNIVRQLFGFQYLLSFYEPLVPSAETLHTSDLPYLRQQSHRVLQKSFSGGACVSLIFLLFLLVWSVLWSWQKKDPKEKFTSICHERLASVLPYTIPFLSYMP